MPPLGSGSFEGVQMGSGLDPLNQMNLLGFNFFFFLI